VDHIVVHSITCFKHSYWYFSYLERSAGMLTNVPLLCFCSELDDVTGPVQVPVIIQNHFFFNFLQGSKKYVSIFFFSCVVCCLLRNSSYCVQDCWHIDL